MNANTTLLGTVLGGGRVGEQPRLPVTIEWNPTMANYTVRGPHVSRDMKNRTAAVKWIKSRFTDPSNGAEWVA